MYTSFVNSFVREVTDVIYIFNILYNCIVYFSIQWEPSFNITQ